VPRRATALLLAATAFVFVPPGVDPGAVPTWLPSYPDQPARAAVRSPGLRQDAESKPPSQFGTALKLVGLDHNNGLHRDTNLVGPTNYSVSCFFYKTTTPAGDAAFWTLNDAGPTNYHNIEVLSDNEILLAWNGGFVLIETFVPGKWMFACISVGTGGNADAYVGVVGGPLTHTVVTGMTTGWTPTTFEIGTDDFLDNFDGRLTGFKVHSVPLSAAEALAESTRILPARTANIEFVWKLENAATRLIDSSGFVRNLSDIGAGSWSTEEGPFLQDGPFDPSLKTFFEQVEEAPALRPQSRGVLDGGGAVDFTFVPAGFSPANSPSWLPQYPDFARRLPRLVPEGGLFEVPRAGLGAIRFDSANDPLFRSGLPANNTSYTVCGWAKFDAATADDSLIWVSDAAGTGLALEFKTGQVALVDTFGFTRPATISGALVDQKYYFIALRVNGTTATIFRGTETDAIVSATGTIVAQGASFKMYFSYTTSNFLTGGLSLWKLYDAQLTDAEIEAERLSFTTVRTSNLSGFWKFASEADKLVDSSVNGNTLSPFAVSQWENIRGPVLDFVSKMAWQPTFSDFARARAVPVEKGGEAPFVFTPTGFDPSTGFPWDQGVDQVRAAARNPQGGLFWTNLEREPQLDWSPDYPDFAGRAALRPVNEGGLFRTHLEYEPTTDWSPDYPDFPGQAAKRATALAETGLSFLDPDFVPKLAWAPSYPDFARAKPRPVDTGLSVLVIQEREAVTDWLPDYPDFARAAPRPVNEGGVFRAHLEYEPTTDWLPDYPDFAGRKALRPVNEGGYASLDNFDFVPKLSWSPAFPDFARTSAPLVREGFFALVIQEREPTTDWLPDFPDFARAAPRPVNEGGVFRVPATPPRIPVTDWLPDFPDFARAAARPVNEGGVFRTHLEYEPTTDWSPEYPDFPGRALPRAVNEGGLAPFDNFDFVPKLSWSPSFPDFARAARPPLNVGGAFFVKLEREPDVDWLPDFPDFARAAPRPVNEGGQFRTHLEYEPTDWFPSYQDAVAPLPRALTLREGGASFLDPDFVPKLSWEPSYPDFARAAKRPVNEGGVFRTHLEREPQLDWSPDYPDFAARALPRAVNEGGYFFQRFVAPTVNSLWYPDYPDFARGKTPLVPQGQSVIVIQEREPAVDWLPDYPDFARKAQPPVNVGGVFRAHLEYEPYVDWAPSYPDFAGRALPRPVDTGTISFLDLDYTPALAWSPDFPDFARAAPRPVDTGAFGYTRIFIRVPDVEWLPIMPDFIWQKAPLVQEGGSFFVKLEREPSTDWMPTFPDFVFAAPVPVNEGGQSPNEINEGDHVIFEAGTATGKVLLHGQVTLLVGEGSQILRPSVQVVFKKKK